MGVLGVRACMVGGWVVVDERDEGLCVGGCTGGSPSFSPPRTLPRPPSPPCPPTPLLPPPSPLARCHGWCVCTPTRTVTACPPTGTGSALERHRVAAPKTVGCTYLGGDAACLRGARWGLTASVVHRRVWWCGDKFGGSASAVPRRVRCVRELGETWRVVCAKGVLALALNPNP